MYPKEYTDEGYLKRFTNLIKITTQDIIVQDRVNEMTKCIDAHLESTFKRIVRCGLRNWTIVDDDYTTIYSVYQQLDSAQKMNSKSGKRVLYFGARACQRVSG